MFERFYPHRTAKNVFELGEEFYTSHGIRGVIFDIDNTLVTHDTIEPPQEILNYFKKLEDLGIKIAIVSNNKKERVVPFCKNLNYPSIYKAWKPFKKNLARTAREFGLPNDAICLVGDQIFTDIYGGRRMNFYSVLVTAVGENETKFVAFKRIFEKLVMNEYYRRQSAK